MVEAFANHGRMLQVRTSSEAAGTRVTTRNSKATRSSQLLDLGDVETVNDREDMIQAYVAFMQCRDFSIHQGDGSYATAPRQSLEDLADSLSIQSGEIEEDEANRTWKTWQIVFPSKVERLRRMKLQSLVGPI